MKTILANKARAMLVIMALCLAPGGFQIMSAAVVSGAGMHGQLTDADYTFLATASHWSVMELALAHVALQKSSNAVVNVYAQHMVDVFQQAGKDATLLATQKGVDLPEIGTLEERKQYDIAKLDGPNFDQAYMSFMVLDHKSEVALFGTEAVNATDLDLKGWAAKMLSFSQVNLNTAKTAAGALTGSAVAN